MRSQEIKCLQRLEDKMQGLQHIMVFLKTEKLISNHTLILFSTEPQYEHPYIVHRVLTTLLDEENIQLVDYNWQLLPIETICITIVTKQMRQDFTWNT